MASAPNRAARPPVPDRDDHPGSPDRRDQRLAELVVGLTACDDERALDAVRSRTSVDDPLELVARAITGIRRGTEPQDRFRVAGFLRADPAELPRRRAPRPAVTADRAAFHLVHHGSLRRWERTGVGDHPRHVEPGVDVDIDDDSGETVIDLRDRTSRFRRPGR